MTEKHAIQLISRINSTKGFVYCPSSVSNEPSDAIRHVQVIVEKGKATVKINADGDCLKSIKQSIKSALGDAVEFVGDPKPKQSNQGATDDDS